jgi:hypothetical protein
MTLDREDIELIAARVAERLSGEMPTPAARLADARTVARELGVDRDWVYSHARELGAVRLGGERGRLRFDLAKIRRQLAPSPHPDGAEQPLASRRRQPQRRRGHIDLLPYTELPSTHQRSGRAACQRPRPDNGKRGPDAHIP